MAFDLTVMEQRQARLEATKVQLKTEFFGLDSIIDRVCESIYAWYLFPQLMTRPVIINLWGMTGVGKTQLVRRLTHLLGLFDHYVEVQMDGTSRGSGIWNDSIASILRSSSIAEGHPGVLLLDEIQRFRTVDNNGGDVQVERFQDVWMLLSDGRFAADSSLFREVEEMIAQHLWNEDQGTDEEPKAGVEAPKKRKDCRFSLNPWAAQHLKRILKLEQDVQEIMTWSLDRVQTELMGVRSRAISWEIDYSKLLIFVSGNLDEAFPGADATNDCDTDADIYHGLTKKIKIADIKAALKQRFRPEQIARLGNNHIIYTSLSKQSYQRLIERACCDYAKEMGRVTGLSIVLDPLIYQEIYENSVYPAQGTRPVFSSIHKIFNGAISVLAVWAIRGGHDVLYVEIDPDAQAMVGSTGQDSLRVPVDLDLRSERSKHTEDFSTMVAVHEAGHALVHAVLFHQAPKEVNINLASFKGGYNVFDYDEIMPKTAYKDRMAVLYGGTAAEEIVFGPERRSTGCASDISKATKIASNCVRDFGFQGIHSRVVEVQPGSDVGFNTDMEGTSVVVEEVCREAYLKALDTINAHAPAFRRIVGALLEKKHLDSQEFTSLVRGLLDVTDGETRQGYRAAWLAFIGQSDGAEA